MFRTFFHDDAAGIGELLAGRILDGLAQAGRAGRSFILGCPGRRGALPVYEALGRRLTARPQDCSRLIIALTDEYLLQLPGGGLSLPPPTAHFSCLGFGLREIIGRINVALPPPFRVPKANLWLPRPDDPAAHDRRLEAGGGIDLSLLTTGAGDHIAFNEPQSARDSGSRVVRLAEETRRGNLAAFPDFRDLSEVPRYGITIGLGSIARLSRSVVMSVWGEGKQQAFRRIGGARGYDPDWPATILSECANAELHVDRAAAAGASAA